MPCVVAIQRAAMRRSGAMPDGFPDNESIKAFNQSIADEFRANDGKVGGQFEGANLLLLTTTGAKSGQPRLSPLAYFRIDGKLIVIGSFAGADVDPAWVHNLRANPSAHIEVANESSDVTARELPLAERGDLFPKITAVSPGFAEYQAKTSRVIPLFELRPAG
jgi:deazaflavin-dependent oxidoreductase (nitroreductase family)